MYKNVESLEPDNRVADMKSHKFVVHILSYILFIPLGRPMFFRSHSTSMKNKKQNYSDLLKDTFSYDNLPQTHRYTQCHVRKAQFRAGY